MGEYVSLDMGCTWKFKSSLFNSNELQSLESFLLLRSVPVFLVGRFMPFKSAHWTFFNIAARVNDAQYAKVSAVMATVNIVQTLDAWMIVVNIGRKTIMSDLSELVNKGGLIDAFKIKELEDEYPPMEPIKVADWLIDRGLKTGIRLYGKSELRQIAKHLLIYCGDE